MDFFSNVMKMLMPNADGGPGQMFSSFFMNILNQTSSMLAPFFGMSGGSGDPTTVLNGVAQQVLQVMSQMTMMFSNSGNSQFKTMSRMQPDQDDREYVLIKDSVERMNTVQNHISQVSSSFPNGPGDKRGVDRLLVHLEEAQKIMDTVWKSLDENYRKLMSNDTLPFMTGIDLDSDAMRTILIDVQNEMKNIWKALSFRMQEDMILMSANGSKRKKECPECDTRDNNDTRDLEVEQISRRLQKLQMMDWKTEEIYSRYQKMKASIIGNTIQK